MFDAGGVESVDAAAGGAVGLVVSAVGGLGEDVGFDGGGDGGGGGGRGVGDGVDGVVADRPFAPGVEGGGEVVDEVVCAVEEGVGGGFVQVQGLGQFQREAGGVGGVGVGEAGQGAGLVGVQGGDLSGSRGDFVEGGGGDGVVGGKRWHRVAAPGWRVDEFVGPVGQCGDQRGSGRSAADPGAPRVQGEQGVADDERVT